MCLFFRQRGGFGDLLIVRTVSTLRSGEDVARYRESAFDEGPVGRVLLRRLGDFDEAWVFRADLSWMEGGGEGAESALWASPGTERC